MGWLYVHNEDDQTSFLFFLGLVTNPFGVRYVRKQNQTNIILMTYISACSPISNPAPQIFSIGCIGTSFPPVSSFLVKSWMIVSGHGEMLGEKNWSFETVRDLSRVPPP